MTRPGPRTPSSIARLWALALAAGMIAAPAPTAATEAPAGPWSDDFFAGAVTGSWTGTGVVYGNEVELERSWGPDLGGQFLRADMRVRMASGGSFRALTFWRRSGANRYEVVWRDESGKVMTLEAVGSPAREEITALYLDQTPGQAAEWRRMAFRITGDDEYRELLYRNGPDGWEQIAEFKFTRTAEP